jgi:hypothetical protein
MWAKALPGLVILLATTAGAAASGKPAPPLLRGPAKASAPAPAKPLTVQAPAFGLAATPAGSVAGPDAAAAAGGAQCRLSCAHDLYMCRVDRDEVDCNPVWSRCVAACPEHSSDTD